MRLRELPRDRCVWLFAALTAVFFYRPLTTETFFFRDLYRLYYPKKVLLAAALKAGTFPLWDPFTNGGQPYLATPNHPALHPTNVLYAFLPTIVAFNWIPVLHVFFCAVAAYWLGRVVGLSRAAAFVTGVAYAFAGVTLSGINFSAWILAFPWVPLTVGLTHRALRDGRSIVPAAFAAAMPLYAGMAELTALQFALLIAWIAASRSVTPRKRFASAAIVVAGALGLSLAVTLPATSVIAQSSRGTVKRSYESFTSWSVHPRRLPELVIPRYFGPTDTLDDRDYWGGRWETGGFPYVLSIYFGVPLLLLAAFGASAALEGVDAPRRTLAVLAVAALLLSLGRYLPGFRIIYDYVPFVTLFRYPVKVLVLAVLPVALVAGCGAQRVSAQKWPWVIAAMVTIDLLAAGWRVNAYAPRSIFDEPPLAAIVRRTIGPLRFHATPREIVVRAPTNEIRWLVQSQLATLNDYSATAFGIPVIFHSDYDGLAPRYVVQLGALLERAPWPQKKAILDRAGVRAFLTQDEVRLPGVTEVTRIATPSGPLRLYANAGAAAALFAGACGRGPVRLFRRELNLQRYEVDAPCDGHVVFAENHYEGWRATVDGRETPHRRADYAFTAIAVRAGHHTIDRRYFPPRFLLGIAGSVMTALLLVALHLGAPASRLRVRERRRDAAGTAAETAAFLVRQQLARGREDLRLVGERERLERR